MRTRLISAFLLLVLLASLSWPGTPALAQSSAEQKAAALLSRLTPEERVGQLVLVTFQGSQIDEESPIFDLISNYHVGGVVLTSNNDNFVAAPDTLAAAYTLTEALQNAEWEQSLGRPGTGVPRNYIPLWVAIAQEGGGPPNDEIFSGLTTLPDQMAIGATWNTQLANNSGQVMGRELSALGFNLYMGLSLDVLSNPNPSISADLSTRVFGGDPYWVAEMGRAFISGMREGSNGRMAIIAKHFPGRGSTDRPTEQEVATVRRSLEELKQIELAPFFAVTGNATSPESVADGLLVSHIRYQGFQGNIRATTRPISFDPQALGQILSLPQLAEWRANGGIMISDDLGTPAVRRFYDPGQEGFSARIVARDAFLAGNDLLYLGNIRASDVEDNYTTVIRILDFFAQKYREDPAFAASVDESVLRLVTAKYELYPTFNFATTRTNRSESETISPATNVTFEVARQAASLLSPSRSELSSFVPNPPGLREYIVFITDTRIYQQCSTCPEQVILPREALQNSVLALYGPQTGALVTPTYLSSFTFEELQAYLDNDPNASTLGNHLRRASWVVFSTLDLSEGRQQEEVFKRFFDEKQSLLLNKRTILFAFGAPYYLDATDISNLTAYYGLYSESEPFIEVAARLLFQEITPVGASPVSIPGLGYDLISAMAPSPEQTISLTIEQPEGEATETAPTPMVETLPEPIFEIGESINVRTGTILDHNGRPVPDGTVVRFILQVEGGLVGQQIEATTSRGSARATFRLDQAGSVQIRATSEPANLSDIIQINVSGSDEAVIVISPTPEPTSTPNPTPISTPEAGPRENPLTSEGLPNVFGWLVIMLVLLGTSGIAHWVMNQLIDPRWAIRWATLILLGGLATYNYLIFEFPGTEAWLDGRGLAAFLQAVIIGQIAGFGIGWAWRTFWPVMHKSTTEK